MQKKPILAIFQVKIERRSRKFIDLDIYVFCGITGNTSKCNVYYFKEK